ncbi:unnamed protein product [Withania somnifera]
MILPVFKLGTLALKSFCKPIGNHIKKEAGYHPRLSTKLQRRIYGHATDVAIRPLNEDKAVQAAADLVGELFVFSVSGVAVIFEVQRSSRSEARKEEVRKQELEAMKQRDEELSGEIEFLKNRIDELERQAKTRRLSSIFSIGHAESTKDKVKAY